LNGYFTRNPRTELVLYMRLT